MNQVYLLTLLSVLTLSNCGQKEQNVTPQWHLVFQNDINGEALWGDKEDLMSALKSGTPIRIAWGQRLKDGRSCLEFSQPDFISIMNEDDVVVQVPLSYIQTDYINAEKSYLKTSPPIAWRALLSTTGLYHQFHYDHQSLELTRIMYSRTNVSWFVQSKGLKSNEVQPELFDETSFVTDSVIHF